MIDFSVLIPVYNTKAAHLLEAVDSIMNQTIRKINETKYSVVLIDDGSTNTDTLIALQYLRTLPEIKVHTHDTNKGTSAALNTGHRLIESNYIVIHGADDISHKDRLLVQARYMTNRPDVDVLGTNLSSYYNDDIHRRLIFTSKHVPAPTLAIVNKQGWQTNHGTVMYKNQAVKDVGGYDETKRRAQDVDLWRRMLEKGKIFKNVHDTLYLWRRFR